MCEIGRLGFDLLSHPRGLTIKAIAKQLLLFHLNDKMLVFNVPPDHFNYLFFTLFFLLCVCFDRVGGGGKKGGRGVSIMVNTRNS